MAVTIDIRLPTVHPYVGMDTRWLLDQAAALHGDKPFLTWRPFEGDIARWTYAEMRADVKAIASGLIARGVRQGDAVIIHMENAPEAIFTWLACGEIGAVGVTTNARCSGEEVAYFAEKSGATGVVTQPQFETLARDHLAHVGWIEIVPPAKGVAMLGGDAPIPDRPVDPAAPFSVQFTSGTTSRPKGVVWTHANAMWGAQVNARHLGLRSSDIALVVNPLSHTMSQAWQVLGSIWVGASIVVMLKFSASRFWQTIIEEGVTWTSSGAFTREALAGQPIPADHRLRMTLGMAAEHPSEANWFTRTFVGHGMTETISQNIHAEPFGPIDPNTMGRPSPEYALSIRRPDGSECAVDEPGELFIKGVRGLSIFAEYLNDPGATAAAFAADGYFSTGDVVRMRPDGAFLFVDRTKDMLKVGGENVAASEIEAVIMRIEGVHEATVVGQPHAMLTEVPYAFVIPAADAPADLPDRIVAACRSALADFKVPRGVELVEALPRSLGVKVAKAKLRQMLAERAEAARAQPVAAG